MPEGSYWKSRVKCPYYRNDNGKNVIECEGLTPGAHMKSIYRRQKSFLCQIEKFCSERYWCCEICEALDTIKYKDQP